MRCVLTSCHRLPAWPAAAHLLLLVQFLAQGAGAQVVEETGTLRGFLAGEAPGCAYDNWISHVSENVARPGYNAYAPALLDPQMNGFGGFQVLPAGAAGDSVLTLFRQATTWLLLGDAPAAASRLAAGPACGYEAVALSDSSLGRDFLLLRESLDSTWTDPGLSPGPQDDVVGGFARGWGIVVVNPASTRPDLALEMPHPCDDFISPYLGLEAFLDLDAGLLLINGAGREVAYTGSAANFTNSVSLSDPSRNCRLPFAAAHEAFLAHVRGQGRDELVVQLHSYDDLAHRNLTSCVVTAGPSNRIHYPPLHDTGGADKGLLDNLRQPVFPVDSLGWPHAEWRLQDYVSSNPQYPVYVDGGLPDSLIQVPVSGSLPGYGANCQITASYGANYPECDRLERFLHVELDELPAPAHILGAGAFYGCGPDTAVATLANFAASWAFYRPFVAALRTAVDSLAAFTDSAPPTAPAGLTALQQGATSARLRWTPTRSVRFNTYEVLVDTALVIGPNPRVVTRTTSSSLCWPGLRTVDIGSLTPGEDYSFALRARDAQGRVSPLSNTVRLHIVDQVPPAVAVEERRAAPAGEPFALRASVTDHSPLAPVRLRWQLGGGGWQETEMVDAGGGHFDGWLAPLAAGDSLLWLVEAEDLPGARSVARSDTTLLCVLHRQAGLDFDASAQAVHEAFGGGGDQWRREACLARAGQAWRFGGANCTAYAANGAAWLALDSLVVPSGLACPRISLWSRMDAEVWSAWPDSCYDGGLVQWSLDGGPWEDAPLEPPATHALRWSAAVPLERPRRMLSGSGGWRELLVPLPDTVRTARLRLCFVSDAGVHKSGWAVDEAVLWGINPAVPPAPRVSLTVAEGLLRLAWHPAAGATAYRVEANLPEAPGQWESVAETSVCEVLLDPAPLGARRLLRVRALGGAR